MRFVATKKLDLQERQEYCRKIICINKIILRDLLDLNKVTLMDKTNVPGSVTNHKAPDAYGGRILTTYHTGMGGTFCVGSTELINTPVS